MPDGVTFFTREEVPIGLGIEDLGKMLAFLKRVRPPGASLRRYSDWLQHDGLHFANGTMSLPELERWFASPQGLVAATEDEHAVYTGVSDAECSWYLRFRAESDVNERSLAAMYSLTLVPEMAEHFRAEVLPRLRGGLDAEPSGSHFLRITVEG